MIRANLIHIYLYIYLEHKYTGRLACNMRFTGPYGCLYPEQMQFRSSSKDGAAGYFSEQGPANSEYITNMDYSFNDSLQIARLQLLLGRQGRSLWDEIPVRV